MRRLAIVIVLAAACGGNKPEPDEPDTPALGSGSGSGTQIATPTPKPAEISPQIDAFHDALAPRWHAVGPTRMTQVCGALTELRTKATAVRGAGVPGDLDPEVWGNAMKRIEKTLDQVKPACGGSNQKAFETAFNEVHLAFHDYMDLVVGDHGHGTGDGRGGRRGIH